MTRRAPRQNNVNELSVRLSSASSEEEVRLSIIDALSLPQRLRVVGATDGMANGFLFEFKYDKHFYSGSSWKKPAYGALAQSLYYCRRILNNEIEGVFELPHTLVICDKNGGFVLPTVTFEGLIQFDSANFASRKDVVESLKLYFGRDWLKILNENPFSWDSPPSRQDKGLVKMLEARKALGNIQYYDFADSEQLKAFLEAARTKHGKTPAITVTKNNFIAIFNNWFRIFAPNGASRREWADRFVIDLREQYKLNINSGELSYKSDVWSASTEVYREFWTLYVRPPTSEVDKFIATNKDLIYDESDQNNFGDFYTPIRLASMGQRLLEPYLQKDRSKIAWWDPAAGGGNLFFRFSEAKNVILSTKFKADCDGLKGNQSVSGSLVMQLDFINELVESDLLLINKWKALKEKLSKATQLVFFMNPPFDDQAESGGTNTRLPDGFINQSDIPNMGPRALRSMNTRFFYRILSIARILDVPIYVASFSSAAWVVGPDSSDFFKVWTNSFKFENGFLISSRVFNGIRSEWPVMFSIWKFAPGSRNQNALSLDVFDKSYTWLGKKTLEPFSTSSLRLSEIAKLPREILGPKDNYVVVPPLKNEYELAETIYEDKLPPSALGYFRFVANDVLELPPIRPDTFPMLEGVRHAVSSQCGRQENLPV